MTYISIFAAIKKTYRYIADRPLKNETLLKDRYKLVKMIGSGSYGMVYLCEDLRTHEYQVIKQLRPSKLKENIIFKKEIDLLGKLNHPGIPKLYDHFLTEGNTFYVMEYIEGENAEEQIFACDRTFSENDSLRFLSSLMEIVQTLHEQHVYHLDLRIPNIMMRNGKPFLIDFGLAKEALSESEDTKRQMREQDYYDLGDILLYLLYTTFKPKRKKALPWTEELTLKEETIHLLKRLLGLLKPYADVSEIKMDLNAAIKATSD